MSNPSPVSTPDTVIGDSLEFGTVVDTDTVQEGTHDENPLRIKVS